MGANTYNVDEPTNITINNAAYIMMKCIKIVSIGGGWIVNNRHLNALQQSGLYQVVGVVSDQAERARDTARRHGIPNYTTDLDFSQGWLAETDAVMIGAIPHVHHSIAEAALVARKHVLTEKPMTMRLNDGRRLIELASTHNRTFAVVHNFQFGRAAQAYHQDIAHDRIGRISAVYGVQLCNHQRNIPAWCDDLPLGLFFDEAPHFYYMFRRLAGYDLQYIHGDVLLPRQKRNTPSIVNAQYLSGEGFPVYLHINFDSSLTEWHITIVGEKATVDIDMWRDIYVRLPNDGVHRAKDILRTSLTGAAQHFWGVFTGGLRYASKRHHYGNDEVVRRFYRAIHGEDCLQGMSGQEGLRVTELMHQLISDARYIGSDGIQAS